MGSNLLLSILEDSSAFMELGRVGKNGSCLLEAEGFAIQAGGWSKLVSKVDAGEERRDVDVLEGGGTGVEGGGNGRWRH